MSASRDLESNAFRGTPDPGWNGSEYGARLARAAESALRSAGWPGDPAVAWAHAAECGAFLESAYQDDVEQLRLEPRAIARLGAFLLGTALSLQRQAALQTDAARDLEAALAGTELGGCSANPWADGASRGSWEICFERILAATRLVPSELPIPDFSRRVCNVLRAFERDLAGLGDSYRAHRPELELARMYAQLLDPRIVDTSSPEPRIRRICLESALDAYQFAHHQPDRGHFRPEPHAPPHLTLVRS